MQAELEGKLLVRFSICSSILREIEEAFDISCLGLASSAKLVTYH